VEPVRPQVLRFTAEFRDGTDIMVGLW